MAGVRKSRKVGEAKKPKKPEQKLSLDHLDWLVKERSRIQLFLFQLLRIMDRGPPTGQGELDASLLLQGALFSLWRAIFLSASTEGENYEHAVAFLRRVVHHNAINYPDDVKQHGWSFGYYLNNCGFRLSAALVALNMSAPEWVLTTVPVHPLTQEEWSKHCDLAEQVLRELNKRVGFNDFDENMKEPPTPPARLPI
jgi:hypothetical protein